MEAMVLDLLEYSRLSDAHLPIAPVALLDVVDNARARLNGEIERTKARVDVVGSLPTVRGHAGALTQAISNLLSNALKFVPPGAPPAVRIMAESENRRVRLVVEDHGIGLAAADRKRIFNVFERLHGSETYPGTGIGLALVRKAVERMGGRVGVESRRGGGSRFWIELSEAK
jgi:signal transduction histidine kinase